jgi:acetyltransferase-like isoleucine patch superfamily enzyme
MRMIKYIRQAIYLRRLRAKFPNCVFNDISCADNTSEFGKYVVLFKNVYVQNCEIDSYTYIQANSLIVNSKIGKFCSIANNVMIGMPDHPTHHISSSPVFYDPTQPLPKCFVEEKKIEPSDKKTEIGSDVWIGAGAIIKAGVSIGTGSVVGAGSIVTRNVPEYTINAGNPCRTIRDRFNQELKIMLMNSRWWEFDDKTLQRLSSTFHDPYLFLSELYRDAS